MTKENAALPDFSDPPLHEVALGVQWEPIGTFTIAHLGLAWECFRDRFPNVKVQHELPPVVERVGIPGSGGQSSGIRVAQEPTVPRSWYLDETGNELVQLQADRFIRNWRKVKQGDVYPRYEEYIRPAFVSDYQCLTEFFEREQIGVPTVNQCEVIYVNHIPAETIEEGHSGIEKIFDNVIRVPTLTGTEAESGRFDLSYLLSDRDGEFVGRLRVSCHPSPRPTDNSPGYELRLMARGRPIGPGLEGVLEFMDRGRERIVRAFDEITNPSMQKVWGRNDV